MSESSKRCSGLRCTTTAPTETRQPIRLSPTAALASRWSGQGTPRYRSRPRTRAVRLRAMQRARGGSRAFLAQAVVDCFAFDGCDSADDSSSLLDQVRHAEYLFGAWPCDVAWTGHIASDLTPPIVVLASARVYVCGCMLGPAIAVTPSGSKGIAFSKGHKLFRSPSIPGRAGQT